MKSYRSPPRHSQKPASSTLSAASQLIFAYKTVRVNGNNENSCHEKLAVRNLQNQKHFWFYFCCAPRFEAMAPRYGVDSAIQLCTFRLSSLFSTASERKISRITHLSPYSHTVGTKFYCPLIPDCPTPVVSAIRTHSQGGTYEKETDRTDVIHVNDCCAGFRMWLYS